MGRYKESVGGWFRMWSRLWVRDEKISKLSDAEQGQLVRVMCAANECMSGGHFEVIGIPLTPEQVAEKANVQTVFIQKLVSIGILQKAPFSFKNWEKYQNPDGKQINIRFSKSDLKRDTKHNSIPKKSPHEEGRRKKEEVRSKSVSENPCLEVLNPIAEAEKLAKAKAFR